MMRVAVISDVHGNALALGAVSADTARAAVDRIVCLGDAVQGGAQPEEVVARLRELACSVVIGNADAWLLSGEETGAEAPATSWMLAVREWSLGQRSPGDRAFIAAFQATVEVPLPVGKPLLCAHGSPHSFDDAILPGRRPRTSGTCWASSSWRSSAAAIPTSSRSASSAPPSSSTPAASVSRPTAISRTSDRTSTTGPSTPF